MDRESGTQGMIMRKAASVAMLVVAFVLAFSLAGCKYSDVLTELIEDPVYGEVDEKQAPRYELNPEAELERELTSLIIRDSDRIDEQYRNLPVFDSQVPPDETTDQRENADDTDNKETASKGKEKSDQDDQTDEAGDQENTTEAQTGDATGDSTAEGASDQTTDQLGEGAQDGIAGGGAGGNVLTYDATGVVEQLPEAGSVAAAGQYATIVQMLAGRGGLAAADAGWVDEVRARGVFPDEELEGINDIAIAWSGSRSTGYALDIDALITAKPDYVLVDNADVILSDDERARLNAAGIGTVDVPTLGSADTTDDAVVQAVAIVGQVLSNSTSTFDTSAQVTNYNALHDAVISNCLSSNGGYSYKTIGGASYAGVYQGTSINGMDTTNFSSTRITTVFIDSLAASYTPTATAKRTYSDGVLPYLNGESVDVSGGIGMSVQGESNEFVLLDYYLQVSGVVDNSYDGAKPTLSDAGSGLTAIVIPGFADDIALSGGFLQRNSFSALWYKPNDTTWLTVGDPDFPGVLVRSAGIAQVIASSRDNGNGIYNVGQPYWVRVVPTGMAGSWADGTVESFLVSSWIYDVARGYGVSDACRQDVNSFYETFYRVGDASGSISDFDTAY